VKELNNTEVGCTQCPLVIIFINSRERLIGEPIAQPIWLCGGDYMGRERGARYIETSGRFVFPCLLYMTQYNIIVALCSRLSLYVPGSYRKEIKLHQYL